MEAKAVARYVRIAPRKVRQVANEIKGKAVDEALQILEFTPRAAAEVLQKVLNSAVANAENNYDLDRSNLVVAKAYVDQGPTLKRFRARAQGRAAAIRKRTSHITIIVEEKEG
ncbi:MAG TPA: 50S ribosomal protein L22 [Hydrogenispora sp.]|jgi:large subunit ribosomal protein L22|nr:50S ribosomal protein L22 [Hydrogenispora sp.]